jgi:hypothetical protein
LRADEQKVDVGSLAHLTSEKFLCGCDSQIRRALSDIRHSPLGDTRLAFDLLWSPLSGNGRQFGVVQHIFRNEIIDASQYGSHRVIFVRF